MAIKSTISPKLLVLRPRKWNRWILGAGAVVVLGGAGLIYVKTRAPAVTIPPGDLYTVSYQDVTQTITASGTVQAPQQINLSFSQGGGLSQANEIVTAVYAKVNQHVKAGQILARISDASIQPQVQSAEANLQSAEANLQKVENPATPQAIAVAQAAVQHAQVVLQGAEQAYQDQLKIYNDPLPNEQTVEQAQNAVNQDQAALAAAQANVAAAQNKLAQAQAGAQTSAAESLPQTIQADQQALQAAQAQLQVDQQTLANAQANLKNDQQQLATDQSLYSDLAAQYPQAEQAYQQALDNYNSWHSYGTNPYSTVLSETQTVAQQAQTAYNTLQAAQNQVQTDQTNVLAAEKAVQQDQATIQNDQANLTAAQTQLQNLQETNPLTVQAAQVAVQQAQAAEQQAEAAYQGALESLKLAQAVAADKTSQLQALHQAENTVAQDQSALAQAEASLAQTEAPPTAADIAAAQAAVKSAQAQLASAQALEDETVLRAPIDGVIVQSNYQPGDTISSSTPAFVLDSTVQNGLQVNVNVPEADIGQVHAGEAVQLTISAYPDTTFTGQVLEVEPQPQVINNVTEYTVLTSIDNSSGKVLPGMTANVTIVTGTAKHVLAVPAVALQTFGNVTGVYVKGTPPQSASGSRTGRAFGRRTGSGAPFSGGPRGGFPGAGGAPGAGGQTGGGSSSGSGAPASSQGGGFARGLPAGVYFQPVTTGLFGSSTVQITSGLQAGQTILLVPPSQLSNAGGAGGPGRFRGGIL
ncbi:MAG: efflux RND transporter periplasmic adaptor subunit [Firmicutes bacterium]|nr:efflux RND transporter periplasmic adaptor subunit [Bacillota bacterium]